MLLFRSFLLILAITWTAVQGNLADKKVIIVGAGAAGLAAGARLVEKGLPQSQLTILEAENRIGGRINTVKYGPAVIEQGAQWVHGVNNIVYTLAAPAGELRTDIQTQESTGYADNVVAAYPASGKQIPQDKLQLFRGVMEEIFDFAAEDLTKSTLSLGAYVKQEFQKYLDCGFLGGIDQTTAYDLLDFERRAQGIEQATGDWLDVSGSGYANYDDYEGDDSITWKSGYSALFPLLLKNVPNNSGTGLPLSDRIFLNSKVTAIRWNTGSLAQVVVNNTVYDADVVIVTVSLGVLKEQADKLFVPSLPAATSRAITGLGFGAIAKIFLEFQAAWWDRNVWGGVGFITDWQKTAASSSWTDNLIGFFTMMDQPNILEGWLVGDAARQMETVPVNDLLAGCSQLLKGAIGPDLLKRYTEPVNVIRTTWSSNPNFRGTYSYRSMTSQSMNVWPSDLAAPVEDSQGAIRILFAGEATQEGMYATVQAAIEAGYAAANRIAAMP